MPLSVWRAFPVVSVSPFEGFSPSRVLHGIAQVETGGAVPLLRRITEGRFPPPGDDWPEGFVTRISPRKLSGVGPWGLAN